MKTDKLIECRGLCKRFSNTLALDNVDLEVGRGKIIGLLGPNGSGKTTLIKILNGLIKPTLGEVKVDGEEPGVYTKSIVSYFRTGRISLTGMTVNDVVKMFSEFYRDFDMERALDMCAAMNIGISDRIRTMSKGTKEKVQLILVMSRRAELYLLDEPIGRSRPCSQRLYTYYNNQQLQRRGNSDNLNSSYL